MKKLAELAMCDMLLKKKNNATRVFVDKCVRPIK